jgi:hypothetical protein
VPHHADYFADGLHPTDQWFLHMAMNIIRQLKLYDIKDPHEGRFLNVPFIRV